ncbi:ABC transporter ATP-binding protein/permease [Peptoniphilus sp. KCTC 25270]|uniref:ABC transporter ATP-binding protein n=1 Tax=Peptoniphilus sp. KCTC 25270 TaxID=2897414 RepID=UPI001E4FF145|nr:ABC transporter ATP-binding protein [Peptoniphilus sp. KCTC 25270]MCD1147702.1 ABC transporter ATP-binding protein/permease [Peptoniphilus sp. KCTC 25270]
MKKYITPYIPQICIIILLIFASIFADLYLPQFMSRIVDEGVLTGNIPLIYELGIQMIGLSLVSVLLTVISGHFSAKVSMSFSRDLRNGLFSHVLGLSFEQFEKFGAPSILTRTTDDVTQVERMAIVALRPLVRAPIMFIAATTMAIRTNSRLSLIILLSAPLLLLIVTYIARSSIPWFHKIRKLTDHINLLFRERLTGIRVIRAFHREESEEVRFGETNKDMLETSIKVNYLLVSMLPVFNLIFNLSMIAVLWLAAGQIDAGSMAVGDLMAYIQYITQIMFAVMMFSMLFAMYPTAQASYSRIVEVLREPVAPPHGMTEIPEGPVELTFDHVTFQYPGAERPVLYDLSFTVKEGEKLAIIGGTGSGKSTILKLINRFYDVTEGEIRLNGIPIQKIALETLRDKLGYVPQKSLLFSRTVKSNLNLGLEEDLSDDKVWKLLSIAQANDFISGMEKNLEHMIAQGGKNLSGGQKQRLSIARALAKNPLVYMFDDSFSALDYKTDRKLRQELEPLSEESATIVVAQRVMTVTDADEILVLEDGEILSRGTHEELLKSSDIYREIAISQLGEKEVQNG